MIHITGNKPNLKRINFNVPKKERELFKSACDLKGKSMKEVFQKFMTSVIKGRAKI